MAGSVPAQAPNTLAVGQALLADLRDTEPVGRLVIDLDRILAGSGTDDDILLKAGDTLRVPRQSQEVTVIGEVQNATSHLYRSVAVPRRLHAPERRHNTEGGRQADLRRARERQCRERGGSRWFGGDSSAVQPGDTIVVPLDAERMRPLPLWTAVTTIIYNLAVAVAAVGSF